MFNKSMTHNLSPLIRRSYLIDICFTISLHDWQTLYKIILMGITFDIVSHTRKLLQFGVFDHLADQDISVLHHKVMQNQLDTTSRQLFFKLWRKGDYTSDFSKMQLLMETNLLLMRNGQMMIEEDFQELILD